MQDHSISAPTVIPHGHKSAPATSAALTKPMDHLSGADRSDKTYQRKFHQCGNEHLTRRSRQQFAHNVFFRARDRRSAEEIYSRLLHTGTQNLVKIFSGFVFESVINSSRICIFGHESNAITIPRSRAIDRVIDPADL